MRKLTPTQKKVLEYVLRYHKENGFAPTYREVADNFGWSAHNSAVVHLGLIEKKGWLRRTPRGYVPA